jgi:hypothetical protein
MADEPPPADNPVALARSLIRSGTLPYDDCRRRTACWPVICLADRDPAGALAAVAGVLDGTAPVLGSTVQEAYLLAGLVLSAQARWRRGPKDDSGWRRADR